VYPSSIQREYHGLGDFPFKNIARHSTFVVVFRHHTPHLHSEATRERTLHEAASGIQQQALMYAVL
jgi:hypothetical protein